MAIMSGLEATLTHGEWKRLYVARFERCRLTLTGIAGEYTTIPFKVRRLFGGSQVFEASEVALSLFQTFPSAGIYASAPEGVGALDIVYEVRTRADA